MHTTMLYIQRRDGRQLETVDECKSRSEANFLRSEYTLADPSAKYYISHRACKSWDND